MKREKSSKGSAGYLSGRCEWRASAFSVAWAMACELDFSRDLKARDVAAGINTPPDSNQLDLETKTNLGDCCYMSEMWVCSAEYLSTISARVFV